ncbi:antitoxin [Streptomyces sp. 2A115]|uniref:antitoxin n=1 Tax=Streptomyces sp. 2A115 TaxID=3457439 RepID=UPI003FD57CBF
MGLLDSLKAKLVPAEDKVSELTQQHGGKIEHGLDKVANRADKKTKGRYSNKIHTGTGTGTGALDRLARKESDGTDGGTSPPSAPPPPPSTP